MALATSTLTAKNPKNSAALPPPSANFLHTTATSSRPKHLGALSFLSISYRAIAKMSSLRNSIQRRNHKERAQPLERRRLGLLEKHKVRVNTKKKKTHHMGPPIPRLFRTVSFMENLLTGYHRITLYVPKTTTRRRSNSRPSAKRPPTATKMNSTLE